MQDSNTRSASIGIIARSSSRLARRVPAIAAAILLLAGCAAGPGSADEEAEPAADPARWGLDWEPLGGTIPTDAEKGYWQNLAGAGALWAYQTALPTTLYGTTDGLTWLEVDLTQHGLPAEAVFSNDYSCPGMKVFEDHGSSFVVLYTTGYGSHPLGIAAASWLAEITAEGEVTVTHGADIGLETMPPGENGWDFRTRCIAEVVDVAGTTMMVGGGQWWQPYKTGSYDLFSATRGTDGSWSVYSTNAPPMNSSTGNHYLAGAGSLGNELVMASLKTGDGARFTVWRTTDGRSWSVTLVDAITEGELNLFGARFTVTSGGMMALLGTYSADGGDIVAVWSSADGSAWERTDLTGPGAKKPILVTESPTGLLALVEGSTAVTAWGTADGHTCALLADDLPLAATGAVPVAGGLAFFTRSGLWASGVDWD